MAANFLTKIAEDIFHEEENIRILALSTVNMLNPNDIQSRDELELLLDALKKISRSHSQDVRFLARKGLNHLRDIELKIPGLAPQPEPEPEPVTEEPQGPPPITREDLLAQLSSSNDAVVIASIISQLQDFGTQDDARRIAALLRHPDSRVRANAAEFIGQFGEEELQLHLLVPMMGDEDNRVKGNVATALGRLGHPKVQEYLNRLLEDNKISNRESAVYALCNLRGRTVVDLLIKALQDPYESIRLRAAKGLGKQGDSRAMDALQAARSDEDPTVGEAATQAMELIEPGSTKAAAPPAPEPEDDSLAASEVAAQALEAAEGDDAFSDEFFSEDPLAESVEDMAAVVEESLDAPDLPPRREEEEADDEGAVAPLNAKPQVSKKSMLMNLGNAADLLLGSAGPRLAQVQKQMMDLDREGLRNLQNFELGNVADLIFKKIRTGELNHSELSPPYYDILKYTDFLKKQQERHEEKRKAAESSGFLASLGRKFGLGGTEEESTKQAMERLEQKLAATRIDLARQALDLLARGEIALEGGADMVAVMDAIDAAVSMG
mgnify:CR=1 FL=1